MCSHPEQVGTGPSNNLVLPNRWETWGRVWGWRDLKVILEILKFLPWALNIDSSSGALRGSGGLITFIAST